MRVEAEAFGIGGLKLIIYWFDNSSDTCTITTKGGKRGRFWLSEEQELLAEMIKRGATPLEVAPRFLSVLETLLGGG